MVPAAIAASAALRMKGKELDGAAVEQSAIPLDLDFFTVRDDSDLVELEVDDIK